MQLRWDDRIAFYGDYRNDYVAHVEVLGNLLFVEEI
jgi:hypothetical protein